MDSNIKILIKVSIWFLSLLFICFYGIFHVSAETYDAYLFNAQLYDNVNGSLSTVTTNFSNNYWTGTIPYMGTADSGAAWGISSPIPLIESHTYSMTVFVSHECGNTVLSSYNRIGVGSSFNEAKTSYQNNSNVNENLSKVQSLLYGQGLQFAFTTSVNANYIVFPFATSVSCNNVKFDLNNITIEDLGSSGVSETTINNSLNNQTSNINSNSNNNRDMILNSQASNTQTIIDNQSSTTQAIIDSSSSNTQAIIDSNKENFNTCRDSVNLLRPTTTNSTTDGGITFTINSDYSVSINGTATTTVFYNYNLGYLSNLKSNTNYVLSSTNKLTNGVRFYVRQVSPNYTFCSFGNNENSCSFSSTSNTTAFTFIMVPSGATINNLVIYPQLQEGTVATQYEKFGEEICQNKLDEAEQTRKGILGKIGDLISGLFDTSGPDTDSLNNMAGWLPPGPVDSILNLPLTFFNTLNNSLGSSCTPFTVSIPYVNKNLTLPCFSDYMTEHVSSFGILWAFIGGITSVVILYRYLLALYAWVDDILMMRYNFHEDFGGNSGNFGGV